MAKTPSKETSGGSVWTAAHRYGDVYECDNGQGVILSHSLKGLEAAKAHLELKGDDVAVAQLKHVDAKIKAINSAPVVKDVAEDAGAE
jgi:hypothetical protein